MWWNQIRSTGIQIFIIDPETKRFADAVFFLNQLRTAETRGTFYRTDITFNYTTAKIIERLLPFLPGIPSLSIGKKKRNPDQLIPFLQYNLLQYRNRKLFTG